MADAEAYICIHTLSAYFYRRKQESLLNSTVFWVSVHCLHIVSGHIPSLGSLQHILGQTCTFLADGFSQLLTWTFSCPTPFVCALEDLDSAPFSLPRAHFLVLISTHSLSHRIRISSDSWLLARLFVCAHYQNFVHNATWVGSDVLSSGPCPTSLLGWSVSLVGIFPFCHPPPPLHSSEKEGGDAGHLEQAAESLGSGSRLLGFESRLLDSNSRALDNPAVLLETPYPPL